MDQKVIFNRFRFMGFAHTFKLRRLGVFTDELCVPVG